MRLTIAVLALLIGTSLPGQTPPAPDRAEVLAVVQAFHSALAEGDSTGALRLLDPAVVIHESGRTETLTEYRSGHLRADIAFAAATTRQVIEEAVTLWDDVALYTGTSRSTGRWRDRDVDSRGAETLLLTRTPEGWRIRHIHWSSAR